MDDIDTCKVAAERGRLDCLAYLHQWQQPFCWLASRPEADICERGTLQPANHE